MANRKNNRSRRAWLSLLLTALLIPAFGGALAAGDAQINIESANPSGDVLQLIFYSNAEEAPSLETLKVSIDDKPVEIASVNTIDYADPGTTYLFLFDTNTAVTERALPDMQALAKGIVAKFGAMDNALIVPIGSEIDKKALFSDKDKINESIDALTRGSEKTDLYASIAAAIKLLEDDATLRPRRCLVMMADGLDNTADGVSTMEVSTLVSQSHVPVYAVALTYNTKTQERIEAAKSIAGIARLSPGGTSILLKNDGGSIQDAVDAIFAQRAQTYLAVIKAENVRAATTADKAEMTLTQTAAGTELSTSRQVSLATLAAATATDTEQATPLPDESPLPTASAEQEKMDGVVVPKTLLYAAGAALAAAIAATVVVLATKKHGKKSEVNGAAVRFDAVPEPQKAAQKPVQPPVQPPVQKPQENPKVCIVRLGEKEEIVHEGAMTEEILLGEGEGAPILSKTAQEGVKTRLLWRDGTIWAMQNSQGVLVNGAQARTNACLSVGDVLTICGADYRIFYSAN